VGFAIPHGRMPEADLQSAGDVRGQAAHPMDPGTCTTPGTQPPVADSFAHLSGGGQAGHDRRPGCRRGGGRLQVERVDLRALALARAIGVPDGLILDWGHGEATLVLQVDGRPRSFARPAWSESVDSLAPTWRSSRCRLKRSSSAVRRSPAAGGPHHPAVPDWAVRHGAGAIEQAAPASPTRSDAEVSRRVAGRLLLASPRSRPGLCNRRLGEAAYAGGLRRTEACGGLTNRKWPWRWNFGPPAQVRRSRARLCWAGWFAALAVFGSPGRHTAATPLTGTVTSAARLRP